MKLRSKIAASFALLGAVSMAHAEAITFGVQIPPIASINVSQGLMVTPKALASSVVATILPAAAPFIGAFTVNTNMPKWNVYFSLANDGYLIDQNGNYLKDKGAAATSWLGLGIARGDGTGHGQLWIKFPGTALINGKDGTGTPIPYDGATSANLAANGDGVIKNIAANNTLTAIMTSSATKACSAGATICVDGGWVYATSPTLATFGLGTAIDATNAVNAIAGSYTETLYLTLVTAY